MPRWNLSRRALLRGLMGGTSVAVGLPVLEAMLNSNGTAFANGDSLPKRFGIFFWGNGVRLSQWTPSQTGAGWALTDALMPLAGVKDYVSVVSGLKIKTGNERGHHAGCVGVLSAAPMISQDPGGAPYASTFSQPSIDQVVADHIGTQTRFRSLEVGISKRVASQEGTTLRYLSHNGPDNANPPEYSPRALFERVFTDGFTLPGTTVEVDPRLALRRSVLDAVMADVGNLTPRLSRVDQTRVEQHLDGIRTLENQIRVIEESTPPTEPVCELPEEPGEFPDIEGKEQLRSVNQAMSDLMTMALVCDQTRVFSVLFSGSVAGTVFHEVGATDGIHELTHNEPAGQPLVQAATAYTMERFADLLTALQGMPEGDGNVLDNTVILASSDVSEGQNHSIDDYPILVAGAAGLTHPGIHYRGALPDILPENTSRVHLALLQALGLPFTSFGTGGGRTSSALTELLA